jgi:hypothetical protein
MPQLILLAAALVLTSGCVQRRFVVNSDPPGALVLVNNKPAGFAPADNHFTYYGNYHFTLVKPGYATLQVDQKVPAPWYEYPPMEILSEIFWPFHIEDVRRFTYRMEPIMTANPDTILQRGATMRERGQTLQPPDWHQPPAAQAAPAPRAVQPAPVPPGAQPLLAPPGVQPGPVPPPAATMPPIAAAPTSTGTNP